MSNKRTNLKNNADEFSRIISSVDRIRQDWKSYEKQYEISKYIPHKTPWNANRHDWHNAYLFQLIDMYNIVINIINYRYPKNKIRWKTNNQIFHNLSRLLYNCSSNYIFKYIKYDNEILSKDWEIENKDGEN